ncbi:glutamine synthetase [Clostridium grantii]|uniref:Glutamine synthetase n=1 Tax=Clostridium grantii DSM 8605 TaxID=1121316 RepID=A0A1M5XU02_9CLOT|nr:glutamine synthetase [Clostridium grantii]SHI03008.1 glutamine synthetase [Clostridium grantii DSM 8605]
MFKNLVFTIKKDQHSIEAIREILTAHPEIKFVSIIGIDYAGNDTDEKIPVSILLNDIEGFLKGATQTDGSSVVLPGIATLNNAKVDMVCDLDVNWFIDYDYTSVDEETGKPIGTLRIPCFLIHEGKAVDSRAALKRSIDFVEKNLFEMFKEKPDLLAPYGITVDDIEQVAATAATELEFWVKTPEENAQVDELSTSQVLQEQYWARTKGAVRSALEEILLLLDKYGLEAEMGHKEVGGVKGKLGEGGEFSHIMEQLEIDWKYADAVQAADNELWVRILTRQTFRRYGLDVSFLAKPITGVAGNGEHTHLSFALKLKNGKRINLFTATDTTQFLSVFGYASVMGILNNYEVINPFVSATNDSLRRLKPGFEAPVCIVTSLGHDAAIPSRNRTILIGVVRDLNAPLATRFELRAPNPHTNTWLTLAVLFMACNDGINYAISNNKSEADLLAELSKNAGEEVGTYLAKDRAYRSEEDVFEDYSDEERERLFGRAPATVYENLLGFEKYPEKYSILTAGEVFTDKTIASFKDGVQTRWLVELTGRIIPEYMSEVRSCKKVACSDSCEIDAANWEAVQSLRVELMKDTVGSKSIFSKICVAADKGDYATVSDLQVLMDAKIETLKIAYANYKKNILDL